MAYAGKSITRLQNLAAYAILAHRKHRTAIKRHYDHVAGVRDRDPPSAKSTSSKRPEGRISNENMV